mmetsp:Transcript_10504/g.30929  ORF Transcript_10504/g.30929 Transcript_10504/m.30929 type:complete len:294 (-) Transcript_10504:718-1599(-)
MIRVDTEMIHEGRDRPEAVQILLPEERIGVEAKRDVRCYSLPAVGSLQVGDGTIQRDRRVGDGHGPVALGVIFDFIGDLFFRGEHSSILRLVVIESSVGVVYHFLVRRLVPFPLICQYNVLTRCSLLPLPPPPHRCWWFFDLSPLKRRERRVQPQQEHVLQRDIVRPRFGRVRKNIPIDIPPKLRREIYGGDGVVLHQDAPPRWRSLHLRRRLRLAETHRTDVIDSLIGAVRPVSQIGMLRIYRRPIVKMYERTDLTTQVLEQGIIVPPPRSPLDVDDVNVHALREYRRVVSP